MVGRRQGSADKGNRKGAINIRNTTQISCRRVSDKLKIKVSFTYVFFIEVPSLSDKTWVINYDLPASQKTFSHHISSLFLHADMYFSFKIPDTVNQRTNQDFV